MRLLFLLNLSLALAAQTMGQSLYKIQLGAFIDAKTKDFENVRNLGFVHGQKYDDGLTQVFLGGYEKKADADKALESARARGFSNAYVQERFINEGQNVTIIQFTSKTPTQTGDWEKYVQEGELYAVLNGGGFKLAVGLYPNPEAAKDDLAALKQRGYKEAFIKTVNSVFLHKISEFETGIKKPLIPIELDEKGKVASEKIPANVPGGYEKTGGRIKVEETAGNYEVIHPQTGESEPTHPPVGQVTAKGTPTGYEVMERPKTVEPNIRVKVKRRSALELQKLLKSLGDYTGSLDGYYGPQTNKSYDVFVQRSPEIQKYAILAQYLTKGGPSSAENRLQTAIDNLLYDASAPLMLETSTEPLAKAYQAYLIFNQVGPSNVVNGLMNGAIQNGFAKAGRTGLPFDPNATYAYNSLNQLLLHLYFLHSTPGNSYQAPCWIKDRHAEEMASIYETLSNVPPGKIRMRSCDQFDQWQPVQLLQSIANDLDANPKKTASNSSASRRAQLAMAEEAPPADLKKSLDEWYDDLLKGVSAWGKADPFHAKTAVAFHAAFFQSQVLLEDYFMDKKFKPEDAKSMAIAALHVLVGDQMDRFLGY